MDFAPRTAALVALVSLAACGGGGGTAGVDPPRSISASWVATLRYEPADVHVSLQTATVPFIYIDAGATNGVYPSPATFRAAIEGANPGLQSGACSTIARMSTSTMQFTDAQGVQAPSYLIFFEPKTIGTCTQSIALGATGVHSFTVTVTP